MTTEKMIKVPIKDTSYQWYGDNVQLKVGDKFSACCGSAYREGRFRISNTKGISLYPFKIGKVGVKGNNTIAHVETPGGVITIVTQERV